MGTKLQQLFQRYESRVKDPSLVKKFKNGVKYIHGKLYFWQKKDLEQQVEALVEQKKEEVKQDAKSN